MKTCLILFVALAFTFMSYGQIYQSDLIVDGKTFSISIPEGYSKVENSFSPQTVIFAPSPHDTLNNLNEGPIPESIMITFREFKEQTALKAGLYEIDDDFYTSETSDPFRFDEEGYGDGKFVSKTFKIENPNYTVPKMITASTQIGKYGILFMYIAPPSSSEKEHDNFMKKWLNSYTIVKSSKESTVSFKKETELNHFFCNNVAENFRFIFDYPEGKKQWVEYNHGRYLKAYDFGYPDKAIEMSLYIAHMGDTALAKNPYNIDHFWHKSFPNHTLMGIEYLRHTVGDHMVFDEYIQGYNSLFDKYDPRDRTTNAVKHNKVEKLCTVEFMGQYFAILVETTGNQKSGYVDAYRDFLYSLRIEKK